ncbi:hypothetical protein D3C80_1045320 [compost metagenome]
MAGKIGEVTSTGNCRVGAPVIGAAPVRCRRGFGEGPAQVPDLADPPLFQPLPHLPEAWQRTSVIGHEQVQPGIGKHLLHFTALPGIQRHRFFHAAMLAGRGHLQSIGVMAVGRRGDVHRVDLGIVDQRLRIGVDPSDAVARGVVGDGFQAPAHHRDQRRSGRLVEGRPAFAFSDTATTDHAPAHQVHRHSLRLSRRAMRAGPVDRP